MEKDEERETLRVWIGQPDQELNGDRVSLSSESKRCLADMDIRIDEIEAEDLNKHEVTLKKLLVELLSGRKTEYADLSNVQNTQKAMLKG